MPPSLPPDAVSDAARQTHNLPSSDAGVPQRFRVGDLEIDRAQFEDLNCPVPEAKVAVNGVHWLSAPAWERENWLWHGFSTRKGGLSRAYTSAQAPGELNLGFTGTDDRQTVARNRQLLAEAITGDLSTPLVSLRQIHSNILLLAHAEDAERELPREADGLVTDQPGILLGIQTADCIPVLVADRKRKVVAAFHAGWRGTVQRIVELGIGSMRSEFGCQTGDLVAAIGPGVGPCCYAVGEEVRSSFESQFAYARELFRQVDSQDAAQAEYPTSSVIQEASSHSLLGPSLHLNLVEANRRQLLDAGLKPEAVQATGGCTSCQTELFFSHRASKGHAGRMMSVIGIRPDLA